MSKLSKTLDEVRAMIAKNQGKKLSEEDTKIALINPVLCALGWQVGHLDEVSCEYRYKPNDDPVDYALLLNGIAAVLVEAKALGKTLAGAGNQIGGYAVTVGVTWVVLTNGDEYRIYNASVPVPFEQKLFRSVRVSDPATQPEQTLLLLSKDKINDTNEQWQRHFADSRACAAIKKLLSPPPNRLLTSFVKKELKGIINTPQIKASLGRLAASFERLVDRAALESPEARPTGGRAARAGIANPPAGDDGPYSDFWEPIRREGFFKGKPVPLSGDAWISKTTRGIILTLELRNHACSVALQFEGEDREERRKKAISLFPAAKYSYETSESDKWAFVRFPVTDKGRKDRELWPEIREKLTKLGEEIYNRIAGSDV